MKYDEYIPLGKANMISRFHLGRLWGIEDATTDNGYRKFKYILADLRNNDNGDEYIIVSTSNGGHYWRTNVPEEIIAFRRERFRMARSNMRCFKKIDRILATNGQLSMFNNLRAVRLELNLQQDEVVEAVREVDPTYRKAMLSEQENNKSYPTPSQLMALCKIYGRTPQDLIYCFSE